MCLYSLLTYLGALAFGPLRLMLLWFACTYKDAFDSRIQSPRPPSVHTRRPGVQYLQLTDRSRAANGVQWALTSGEDVVRRLLQHSG